MKFRNLFNSKCKGCLFLIIFLSLFFTATSFVDCNQVYAKDKVYEWKFFSAYGPGDSACCDVWPALFEKVKRATNGRLDISVFWSGQHPYQGSDMLKVIRDGSAELAHFYGGFLASVEPVFGIDAIPMLFPSDADESFALVSKLWGDFKLDRKGVLERVLEDKWGGCMIHALPASQQRIYTSGYKINGIGSLKGHKVRVYSPELATLVTILGGTPVSIAFAELYTGLSTGLVDGLVTSVYFANAGGFFDFCDTINLWEIMAAADELMVSKKALDKLPPDIRKTFLDIMYKSVTKPERAELETNALVLEELIKKGIQVYVPSQKEREAVIKRCQKEIWAPWVVRAGADAKLALEQVEEVKKTFKK